MLHLLTLSFKSCSRNHSHHYNSTWKQSYS